MGIRRRLGLPAWVIGGPRVGFIGSAVLLSCLCRRQGVKCLTPHSRCSDLFSVLLLPLGLIYGSLFLLPLSFLLLPLLTFCFMSELFFFMFAAFSFSLKKKRLLLTSFLVSENITEWDLIFFVNILCESNTTSGRRCGCGGSRSGSHGFG